MQHWRSKELFPSADGKWSVWRPPFGKRKYGESAVKRRIWQWHPLDPVLVTSPSSSHFEPPVCNAELAPQIHQRMLLQYRLLLALLVVMALGATAAFSFTRSSLFANFACALGLILVFVTTQHVLFFRRIDRTAELAKYVSWLHLQRSGLPLFSISSMLVIGGLQYTLQNQLGGLTPLIMKYGLVFNIPNSELWRFFTGPFMHSGFVHWAGNALLAAVSLGMAAPIAVRSRLFIAGLILLVAPPAMLSFMPPDIRLEAFLGLSGAIFGIFGWVLGISIRRPTLFPANFKWLLAAFLAMIMGVTSLLNERSNDFVHLTGLIIGLSLGLTTYALRKH